MKRKLQKFFKVAAWWLGVVVAGLLLGISLQVVRAWTEPSTSPPGGNVGAPINTGSLMQLKSGILGVLGLQTPRLDVPGDIPAPGEVLTAQDSAGLLAWGGGGGTYIAYGTRSCAAGYQSVYANGVAMTVYVNLYGVAGDTGGGAMVCKDGGGFNGGSGNAVHAQWVTGSDSNVGNSDNYSRNVVQCTVCAKGNYTAYGTKNCAAGWTKAYDGVAMTAYVNKVGIRTDTGAGSDIVCKQGSGFNGGDAQYNGTLHVFAQWLTGSDKNLNRTDNYKNGEVDCAVCVK